MTHLQLLQIYPPSVTHMTHLKLKLTFLLFLHFYCLVLFIYILHIGSLSCCSSFRLFPLLQSNLQSINISDLLGDPSPITDPLENLIDLFLVYLSVSSTPPHLHQDHLGLLFPPPHLRYPPPPPHPTPQHCLQLHQVGHQKFQLEPLLSQPAQ